MELYWIGTDSISQSDVESVRRLFPTRYARALRCVNRRDGLQIIAAGVLLNKTLGLDESMIRLEPNGRPFVPGGPFISISHSFERCVLAHSEEPVGVDIEKLDAGNLDIADTVMTVPELEWLSSSPLERFHILWTRKESVYKAIGGVFEPKSIDSLNYGAHDTLTLNSVIWDGYAVSVCSQQADGISFISIKDSSCF